jgi:hypothetical protein
VALQLATVTGYANSKLANEWLVEAHAKVTYPKGVDASCCGMMFNSRGFAPAAAAKMAGALLDQKAARSPSCATRHLPLPR